MKYISAIPGPGNALPWPRRLVLMGSTGSIGRNALRVAEAWPDLFRVAALAGGSNVGLLADQATRWRPSWLAVRDGRDDSGRPLADALRALLPEEYAPAILTGPEGFARLASLPEADVILSAQVGAAGLRATLAAALAGKHVALANKESLVLAGEELRAICARSGAVVLPVDSEHGAIFQCVSGRSPGDVTRLILTASGGPFRGRPREFLATVTPGEALAHPTWSMGAKISIDSATLMNKGLEVIEACRLYGMPGDKVDVLVHRESLVHSLVEFRDASVLAQLAVPDMRLPLAACLAWPRMLDDARTGIGLPDLAKAGSLHFEEPDNRAFPCLSLARRALRRNLCPELNAANEIAVERFLAGDISFLDIPALVEAMLDTVSSPDAPGPLPGRGFPEAAPPARSLLSRERFPLGPDRLFPLLDALASGPESRDALTRNRARAWRP